MLSRIRLFSSLTRDTTARTSGLWTKKLFESTGRHKKYWIWPQPLNAQGLGSFHDWYPLSPNSVSPAQRGYSPLKRLRGEGWVGSGTLCPPLPYTAILYLKIFQTGILLGWLGRQQACQHFGSISRYRGFGADIPAKVKTNVCCNRLKTCVNKLTRNGDFRLRVKWRRYFFAKFSVR